MERYSKGDDRILDEIVDESTFSEIGYCCRKIAYAAEALKNILDDETTEVTDVYKKDLSRIVYDYLTLDDIAQDNEDRFY